MSQPTSSSNAVSLGDERLKAGNKAAAYYQKNKEWIQAKRKKARGANPQKHKDQRAMAYTKHKKKTLIRMKRNYQENRSAIRAAMKKVGDADPQKAEINIKEAIRSSVIAIELECAHINNHSISAQVA